MTIPRLSAGAKEKGLDVLGTGDATQPQWLNHLRTNLKDTDGTLSFDSVSFILTVEIEDSESIHHLALLPGFEGVDQLRGLLKHSSPNIDHEWGGRPRVNLTGAEIAGLVRDCGGIIGPAHAFTPFRSIFRESRYNTLADCYQEEMSNVHFLELGLSADSELGDYIPELRNLTFITSSDAHSPSPDKIGREFVRLSMEAPTFDEIRLAIMRTKRRKPVLNVGFNPRLGKYYLSFCSKCRRTLVLREGSSSPEFDELSIYITYTNPKERLQLLNDINRRMVKCPSDGHSLRLGVRDRAMMLGEGVSAAPSHRPQYLHIPPLLDLMTSATGIKTKTSKKLRRMYTSLREVFGPETTILTETPLEDLAEVNLKLSVMIRSYRDGTIGYIPGGGGRYGTMVAPWEENQL
ncbi:MAG: endonuclease Q family protein [Candidatus Thorarchaeota archaeon]|jgi:PHP family Zn ribbon phosphoesterase